MFGKYVDISMFVGKIFSEINILGHGSVLRFEAVTGEIFEMHGCPEVWMQVWLADCVGDLSDLLNSPIVLAEEVQSDNSQYGEVYDYTQWVYYKLATRKGYVDLRWMGESDAYSIQVIIERIAR